MATPRLNVDVLAIVCEFLTDVSDVLSIALTCSAVHLVAVGWLLRMRPVYLKSDPSIRRFHSFLFADAPARAPHVCALDINLRWPIDDCSLLVEIFASCQHLKHLTVAFEQASLHIIMDPRFIHAITTIPNLRSFSLHSQSTNALGLLPRLVCTPLRKVGIHCGNVDVSARFPSALELSLPRILVPTLEKLELDRFAVDSHDPQAPPNLPLSSVFGMSVFDMTPYPAVRSLSVGSFKGRPLLDHLQHLFPAVDGTLHVGGLDIRSGEDTYADIRAANQHTQESDGDGSASRTWKKLDRNVCDAAMFYVLGLRCPIRLAMINCGAVEKHRFAADALRENPVPRLKLTLYHESGMFDGLFSPELAGKLTHLTLCLLYSNDYEYTSPHQSDANADAAPPLRWDDVLNMLVSALQPLHKLTHLRVVIGASVYVHREASWPFAPWEEYACSLRPSRFDFEGTAAALAHAVPSLRHVFLTTGGFLSNWAQRDSESGGGSWKPYERWYISHGWRVATPGTDGMQEGARSLVELQDEVAETIIRKEELVLSERDEGALHLNYGWHATTPPLSV